MKAVLVVDKPSSCIDCRYSLLGGCYCTLTEEDLIVKDGDISENCPLKPMPQKKKIDRTLKYDGYDNIIESALVRGFNACVDEILGDNDE